MRLFFTLLTLVSLGATFLVLHQPPPSKIASPVATSLPVKSTPNNQPATAPTQKPKALVSLPLDVPFTVQAPFGEWQDPRQQDACEEAVALMAIKWARGEKIASKSAALKEILDLVAFQQEKYGEYRDTSTIDTTKRLINDYYQYPNATVKPVREIADIISELEKGHLVITPMNGRALNNPYFTPPGPERHNIVIRGFDKETSEFITNDPGIAQGENYRYPQAVFFTAIRDYPTGYHIPITKIEKTMIVVSKLTNNQ